MNITIEKKSVYGRELNYPACDKSRLLALLLGHKTITDGEIDLLKQIGFVVTNLK